MNTMGTSIAITMLNLAGAIAFQTARALLQREVKVVQQRRAEVRGREPSCVDASSESVIAVFMRFGLSNRTTPRDAEPPMHAMPIGYLTATGPKGRHFSAEA